MPSRKYRAYFAKWGGVKVTDCKQTFIGEQVIFDTNYPEDIIIEPGARITVGCILVSHFLNPNTNCYERGQVVIGRKAYLGTIYKANRTARQHKGLIMRPCRCEEIYK